MRLRISINAKKRTGPYGGGNQFVNNLEDSLHQQGHEVSRRLVPNLDAILIAVAQDDLQISSYPLAEIRDYLRIFPRTKVILRVNACDEQRGSDHGVNSAMLRADSLSDHRVFVSEFTKDLFLGKGMSAAKPSTVILNAADPDLFNSQGSRDWSPDEKLRIVTHHWSSNYLKGFDIYERLDSLLGKQPYSDLFEFTIIGNLPLGFSPRNSTHVPPTSGKELAQLLKGQHVYLTGSRYDPGPNHVAEGLQIGLPFLYLESGGVPEYCSDAGLCYDLNNFEEKLLQIREEYKRLRSEALATEYSSRDAALQYSEVIEACVDSDSSSRSGMNRFLKRAAFRLSYPFTSRFRKSLRLARKAYSYL